MRTPQELIHSLDQLVEQLKADKFETDLNETILSVTTELLVDKAKDKIRQRFRDLSIPELFEVVKEVVARLRTQRNQDNQPKSKRVN